MGTLLVHAGRSKTGSSSIQRWLGDNARRLRSEAGLHVLTVTRGADGGGFAAAECHGGSAKSFVGHWPLDADRAAAVFKVLGHELETRDSVVVSSEGFGRWLHERNEGVLPQLDLLARDHDVRVVYYVRPQHTALEAAWRQWGYRTGRSPSDYLESQVESLHHGRTVTHARAAAPHVSFVVRPFRKDLLESGDVVTDFARVFLGLPAAASTDRPGWENAGFPLELVNILRYAPAGMFWTSPHDNSAIGSLRRLGVADWDLPAGKRTQESRRVLQAYCHREYEQGNQELIRQFDWRADYFVPPAQPGSAGGAELTELDQLWEPDASEAEQKVIFCALAALLDRGMGAST